MMNTTKAEAVTGEGNVPRVRTHQCDELAHFSVTPAEALAQAASDAADWLSRSTRIDDQEQASDLRKAIDEWKESKEA